MALSSNQRNTSVFLAAAGITGIAAAMYFQTAGLNDETLGATIRHSARAALLVLLLVFVTRPLRQLLSTPFTTSMLRNRRSMGIAFAGIHTAHLGLLIFKANQVSEFQLASSANLLGIFTYSVILAMLITSYDAPARALGKKRWSLLHKVGLYWLFIAFAQTQLPASLDQLDGTNWWMITLIALALVVRLTAYFAKRKNS